MRKLAFALLALAALPAVASVARADEGYDNGEDTKPLVDEVHKWARIVPEFSEGVRKAWNDAYPSNPIRRPGEAGVAK